MARLSLLLPPWEMSSPRIDEPDLLVAGARPEWRPAGLRCLEVLPRGSSWRTAAGTPDPGHGGRRLLKRMGLSGRLDLNRALTRHLDVMKISVDSLSCKVEYLRWREFRQVVANVVYPKNR